MKSKNLKRNRSRHAVNKPKTKTNKGIKTSLNKSRKDKKQTRTVKKNSDRGKANQIAKKNIAKQLKHQEHQKQKKKTTNIPAPKEAREAIDMILGNSVAVDYLKKNVSKSSIDVLDFLTIPRTDEYIAEQLDIKINSIRRILNIMQGYGITNYYIAKNTNGWLSFAWYMNTSKIQSFFNYINSIDNREVVIKEDCNDYFVCKKCYETNNLIFTFESAFETEFKCTSCKSKFSRISKEEAANLIKNREVEANPVRSETN